MLLVVGLGNPGTKYERNRHNIGFSAVEQIAEKFSSSPWVKKFRGELCEAKINKHRVLLLKPLTYMNLSGESVAAAAHFYKIPPENIIVIHDEIDLLPGKLRVKLGGGSGGHNGLKSIDAHIGPDYWRVRIGVGRPEVKENVVSHVLENFSKEELATQKKMLTAIVEYFPLLTEGDASGFMNKVALKMKA
jgi:PTH1 family peptidyl-tRNA hydrolase